MSGSRQEKVGEAVRAAVADYLIRNLANTTPGLITVTKVKMSPDLKLATVYFSIFGNEKDVELSFRKLHDHLKRIRYHVGQEVPLKYVPELRMFLDDSIAYADHMNRLFRDLK